MREPNSWEAVGARKTSIGPGLAGAVVVALLASPGCGGAGNKTGGTAGTTGAAGTTGGGGTTGTGGGGGSGPVDASADSAPIPFQQQIMDIAAEYQSWGRVDDELRWAPGLCRLPYPGIARHSASDDQATHGQKLYSVFAKKWAQYPNGPHDGQAVVKQSWKVEAVTGDAGFDPAGYQGSFDAADHFYPYAKGPDGGVFRASEPAGLYIMFRLEPSTPGTDEGWVYATVTAAGQLTSAGRVASCMGCHEAEATHERLYGVPKSAIVP